jgi:hypothetical protein
MRTIVKEIERFAHLLGIPSPARVAASARKIANSRAATVVRRVVGSKAVKTGKDAQQPAPFAELLETHEQDERAASERAKAEEKQEIRAERDRCRQIMGRACELGLPNLGYSLAFETALSHTGAVSVLNAAGLELKQQQRPAWRPPQTSNRTSSKAGAID